MKIYVVKTDTDSFILDTWDECLVLLKQYPYAKYKSFYRKDEAIAFLNNENFWDKKLKEDMQNDYLIAFTDGSFDQFINYYSYGVVLIDRSYKEYNLSGMDNDSVYLSSRNIAGEILGVIKALEWAIQNSYHKIKIYYDYEGIEKWADNKWQAKSKVAIMYQSILRKYKSKLEIRFEKVKSHNGNEYNDKADYLAKMALLRE